jgi:hypothetical protein
MKILKYALFPALFIYDLIVVTIEFKREKLPLTPFVFLSLGRRKWLE